MTEFTEIESGFTAAGEDSLIRLDALLARKYPVLSRDEWKKRIRSGDVLLNGKPFRPSRKIQKGEKITFRYLKKPEPETDRSLDILYEDDHILLINKRPGIPVHPSGAYFRNTLYFLIKERYGGDFPVYFAHRLDRETSGLLLLAKNKTAAKKLHEDFMQHGIYKEYLCITEGSFTEEIIAAGYLTDDPQSPVRKKRKFIKKEDVPDPPENSEFSHTVLLPDRVHVSAVTGEKVSTVRCILHTGRMHQIRATLCSLGFPVTGDRLYGKDSSLYIRFIEDRETDEDRRILRMNRTALHSRIMKFRHPATQELCAFEAPLPEDIINFLDEFSGGSRS